jgi:DNA-binding NarL/FixJ family response regulator
MQRVRILLADDFEPLVERVRRLLAEEFEIVGSVNNGRAAIEAVGRLDPDLLVLDIAMPDLNGFEVVARLNPSCCRTRVILLTTFSEPEFISAALARGVLGYVFKNRLVSDLRPAIREVMHGHTFVSSIPLAS